MTSETNATRGSAARMIEAIDEYDIRRWFMTAELSQVGDTLNVCRGIVETRQQMKPKRVRRSEAGKPRDSKESMPLIGNLGGLE